MAEGEQSTTVIVGAGQAGAWVAMTLRSLDPQRRIVLVGDESHPPYERPPLSKTILAGTTQIESAYIKPRDYYEADGIELKLGERVARIDRNRSQIDFVRGTVLSYDVLVLATGARARKLAVPGAELKSVHMLRTAEDADQLKPLLVAGKRIVAIGAGFIGLEVTAVANEAGCSVTVLDTAPHAMCRVVDPSVARALTSSHEDRGVQFRFSQTITEIVQKGDFVEVALGTGERLPADLVVVGIGAIPNTDLASDAGLECDDGVVVTAFGRTSDPKIYAVGDVTRHFNPLLGQSLRLESWQNAQNQGIAVAKVIAGSAEPYAEIPWFWTDQYEANFQIIGAPRTWDRVIWRGKPGDAKYTAIYLSGDRIVAGNTMNNARDIRFLKKMILSGKSVVDVTIVDPATNLARLAKG